MSDALYDLLQQELGRTDSEAVKASFRQDTTKYLTRLLSLRPSDLTSTEPESLQQSNHSNNVSIRALSSRTYRTTSTSFEHLKTLGTSLSNINSSVSAIRTSIPELDDSAVKFGSSYSRAKDANPALESRKQSMVLSRQADKLQDIIELPFLLSTAITSASSSASSGVNYSQALDLFAHIKRLQILYPESGVVKSVQVQALVAMKEMTTNLITALRGQNIRLAAAIRTIGWLRRVLPELGGHVAAAPTASAPLTSFMSSPATQQEEDDFGAIFLSARLCTFLTMTEALAPLRDLADQETDRRLQGTTNNQPEPQRRTSHTHFAVQGQQTERYLKRYIEVFREQSFATISMFRNIFPRPENDKAEDALQIPSALASFPLHLIEIFMETMQTYLPNVIDPTARESLLMQMLYAANSLGRLGADFSMMIAFLEYDNIGNSSESKQVEESPQNKEPEWAKIIKKHKVQAARLEALAAGQDPTTLGRRSSSEVAVS